MTGDGDSKLKAQNTNKRMKDFLDGAGTLCITMRQEDFISIGSSTFIGIRRIRGSQVGVMIVAPNEKIHRYHFFSEGGEEG